MSYHPDFWIEVIYMDGNRTAFPFFGSLAQGEAQVKQIIAMDFHKLTDFCLLLSGDWKPGTIARNDQILADAQSYYVPGAKLCR